MIKVDIKLKRKNFDISIGEHFANGITGIYGPSGSGKTSLLHAIAGLTTPTSGRISVNNKVYFDAQKGIHIPVEKRKIGYVFQEGRLFPHMSIKKNLMYGFKRNEEPKVSLNEVVDLLNLKHILNSKPAKISGGERQRTALGRSILSSPDILLLDEPFSAVDNHLRKQILPFILRIQEKIKIPILVVSHDLPDLLKLTNTICVIKNGKCIGNDYYHRLIKNESIADMFSTVSLVNSFNMKTLPPTTKDQNFNILTYKTKDDEVVIKCDKPHSTSKEETMVKMFINADDIALSTSKIENITAQNQ
ncbi:MAG: ATP-binding cassette domain-containing protein, partial [Bacteroidales bacterium]|nr:ATP-binding cassette domain-containing protein [Bacteroidales bacterium]